MNNYETIGIVGEGAYGIVIKCVQKRTQEIVAIKKFKDKDTEDSLIKKVIIRELRGLRSLKHPNIVNLQDAFRQNERLYLIFDFCEKSLLDLQENYQNNGLPVPLIKSILHQTLKAIDFMHDRGFIHRDIKPENILLSKNNKVKVCDFGFCRILQKNDETLTDYVATRWYRSPELLLTPKYGKSVDIWALGCVVGEMIDGNPMFPGDDFIDQMTLIHKLLGAFPAIYKNFFDENKDLRKIDSASIFRHPKDFNQKILTEKYHEICQSEDLIDLLSRMLDLNCFTRITAKEALRHNFFNTLSKPKDNALTNISGFVFSTVDLKNHLRKENVIPQTTELLNTKVIGQNGLTNIELKLTANTLLNQRNFKKKKPFLPKIVPKNIDKIVKSSSNKLKNVLSISGAHTLQNR